MIEDEKFAEFQNKFVEISQKNYQLNEELKALKKSDPELQKYKSQLESIENERVEMQETYTKKIQELEQKLQEIQSSSTQNTSKKKQIIEEKIVEVKQQITEVTKTTNQSDEEINKLRQLYREYDTSYKNKSAKLEKLEEKSKRFAPVVTFLKHTRPVLMFLEDLSSQKQFLISQKKKYDQILTKTEAEVSNLRVQGESLDKQIKEESYNITQIEQKLKNITLRISEANQEIENLTKTLESSKSQFESRKKETEANEQEYLTKLSEIRTNKPLYSQQVSDKEHTLQSLELQFEETKRESNKALSELNERIQESRRRFLNIKENGDDELVSRVDLELKEQINKAKSVNETLQDKIEMLTEAITLAHDEIKEKDDEIRRIALGMTPTKRVLGLQEFKLKELLLEETLVQNRELMKKILDMEKRVDALKRGNEELRKKLIKK
ncbi:hypothetical protein GPJ56_005804 [Histomonas meleagridis]|uniref:uncharacterized protein n=1 Tax=Histomonas meleagridis TaxID=135588 RepID=UPI003559C02F|nr:hypothetical protein GPJ56_005804 [Histomonas meleagridis]KAH0798660.1 hypothetical protein GO595_008525 [Histomonas meleagridis]